MAPEMTAPPSSPMLTQTAPAASPVPMLEDDIADPAVPETVKKAIKKESTPQTAQDAPGSTNAPPALGGRWAEHEALLVGFCGALQTTLQEQLHTFMAAEHNAMAGHLSDTYLIMETRLKALNEQVGQNEHAQYQLSDALLKIQEHGMRLRLEPYTVKVHARSPQGFPMEVVLYKDDKGELVSETTALMDWLQQNGFTAPEQERTPYA